MKMTTSPRGSKTIIIAFPNEEFYQTCMTDPSEFRDHLHTTYTEHPELFPQGFANGYTLHGFVHSKKQELLTRRIKVTETQRAYQIHPSFLMPYMIARTDEVEKGLYLRRWGVPFEALSHVFGHDPMFWYRAYTALGRNSIVGTTIKDPANLPPDILVDEKHTRLQGEKAYVTTTVAKECILGADIAEQADTVSLTQGYQTFKDECQSVDKTYSPQTINTDGWEATKKALKALFPQAVLILCFLHAYLKIEAHTKRAKEQLHTIGQKVWHVYRAETVAQFSQRIRRLREWSEAHLTGVVKEKVLDLCAKGSQFKGTFQYPTAYRTSNALDRLMNYQDRVLYAMQYLHGSKLSARLNVRAMALLWNFHPYGARTQAKYEGQGNTPFERLNGFRYHDNWLHNLMIASSLQGRSLKPQNPL